MLYPPLDPQLQVPLSPSPLPLKVLLTFPTPGADSDSDSDLSLEEDRSLSIPSSESEDNGRTRGRFQRPLCRAAQSERLLTHPKGARRPLTPWVTKGCPICYPSSSPSFLRLGFILVFLTPQSSGSPTFSLCPPPVKGRELTSHPHPLISEEIPSCSRLCSMRTARVSRVIRVRGHESLGSTQKLL